MTNREQILNSGTRVVVTNRNGWWQVPSSLDVTDPPIPWLPLLTPPPAQVSIPTVVMAPVQAAGSHAGARP